MDAQTSFPFDPRHIKYSPNYLYLWVVQKRSAIVTGNTLLRTCKTVTTFPIYSGGFRFNKSSTASSHIVLLLVIVQHIFDIFKTRTRLFLKDATPKKLKKLQKRLHTAIPSYGVGKPTKRDIIALPMITFPYQAMKQLLCHKITKLKAFDFFSPFCSTDKCKVFYDIVTKDLQLPSWPCVLAPLAWGLKIRQR